MGSRFVCLILALTLLPHYSGFAGNTLRHREALGPSSRLTSMIISEIMYHPSERADGRKLEFIELTNTADTPQDLSGYSLSGDADYAFPVGTVVPGRAVLVVARSPQDVQVVYGIQGVLGPLNKGKGLPNKDGVIRLRNRQGAILLEVPYSSEAPWPVTADGAGSSVLLVRPSLGESDPKAWSASERPGGTPGETNGVSDSPLLGVRINEVSASQSTESFVEVYNATGAAVDLANCTLTDNSATNRFVFPSMVLPPGGFATVSGADFAIHVTTGRQMLVLKGADGAILDGIRVPIEEEGVSYGRFPNGAEELYQLEAPTPGSANHRRKQAEIIINELMYHPISGNDEEQYIELYNPGTNAVPLAGWALEGEVGFTFPAETSVPAGGFLVVAKNSLQLQELYSNLNWKNTVGNFSGTLSHRAGRLALLKPVHLVTGTGGLSVTNTVHVLIDEVRYEEGGSWGQWADGGGSSLERTEARADGRLAASWRDSDETAKANWTTVSVTGRLDNGNVAADQLQVLLAGAGECLIDDVEVLNAAGVNLVGNSSFESDASGWTAEGTESSSEWEISEGYQSARSYHVRAVERGDNQVNRIRTPLLTPLAANSTETIRAKVRWLKGSQNILFRLRGNWLEAAARIDSSRQPGTPGERNSRSLLNSGPAIFDVTHYPISPAAGESVLVTARISDPDGVRSATLRYRVDPSTTSNLVNMSDDGTQGDEVAGDGIYSARIPGQGTSTVVAFVVTASDPPGVTTTFPAGASGRECLVRFGDPTAAGTFPVYRVWMTRATLDEWTGRHKLNNTPLNVTFVLGEDRVIYGAQALYAGSPYIAPGYLGPASGKCGYSVTFPSDDRFLGSTDLVLDWPGGHGGEQTAIQEQMAYWLAEQVELPYCHRYFIRLFVNGVTDMQRGTVFEAVNQPSSEFLKAWAPRDSSGDFYKIDRAFEFTDSGSLAADPQPRLQNYTTTAGAKKTARYRWNFLKRASEDVNNYTNIFDLVDALNVSAVESYTAQTEALVDVEEWMGILALEHIIVNFDSYGHEIGKNMYAYKPDTGKWQLYMFDLDWLMLAAAQRGSAYSPGSASLYKSEDPTMTRMYNQPAFRRAFLRTVKKAVDGPMKSENCDPVMDAKYQSLIRNGITKCDGQLLTDPTVVKNWFAQRRNYLLTQLEQTKADFAITTNEGMDFTTHAATLALAGSAPLEAASIRINGVEKPVNWKTLSTWEVQLDLAPGENTLKIDAYAADGSPLNSDQITVRYQAPAEPVAISSFLLPGGLVRLVWNSQNGLKYQLEYNDDLNRPEWAGLQVVTGLEAITSVDIPRADRQRFYRLQVLP